MSGSTVANVTRDRCQIVHRTADDSSVLLGLLKQVRGAFSGLGDPDQRGVRQLSLRGVFAGGLAELLRGSLLVEEVVNDLKRKADRLAVVAKDIELLLRSVGQQTAEHDRGGDQLRGLVAVNELQPLQ